MTKGISITPDRLGEREFGEGHVWYKKPLTWNVNCGFPLSRPTLQSFDQLVDNLKSIGNTDEGAKRAVRELAMMMGDADEHGYKNYRT